jgi:imidazolonepropionase-like amidohydrolase
MMGGLAVAPGLEERKAPAFAALVKMVGLLYRAGVRIVAGTDAYLPGFVLYRELELYVEAGLPPSEVLRLATLGAAKIMKHDREKGSIEAGKQADLIIVDGNPAERITDIRRIRKVVQNGVIYDTAEVQRAIGLVPGREER